MLLLSFRLIFLSGEFETKFQKINVKQLTQSQKLLYYPHF